MQHKQRQTESWDRAYVGVGGLMFIILPYICHFEKKEKYSVCLCVLVCVCVCLCVSVQRDGAERMLA